MSLLLRLWDALNGQSEASEVPIEPPIAWEEIAVHPSHAVRLNVMRLTGIRPPYFTADDEYENRVQDDYEAYHVRDHVTPRDLLSLRVATAEEYAAFVMKYLEKGGKISDVSESTRGREMLIADHSMTIPRARGAATLHVLVPEGVTVDRIGGDDHGNSFNMVDGSISIGSVGAVYLYPNVAHAMVAAGWKPAWENFEVHVQDKLEEMFGFRPASRPAVVEQSDNLASTIAENRPFALPAVTQPGDH